MAGGRPAVLVGSLRERVERLVEEQLWPAATEADRGGSLPVANFEALIELGLYGMAIPRRGGGLGMTQAEVRETLRLLGSGCGVTAFAFAQHHGTTGSVAATKNTALRERWLPRLTSDCLAGIAYAHVRRTGAPVLSAEQHGERWVLSGAAPWVTSWGLAEVMAVAASTDDGRLLWALVPAVESPGLTVANTFELMVYGATQTVALSFDRFAVEPQQVMSVIDFGVWASRDRLLAARPNPLCLGIGDRALRLLGQVAPEVAAPLEPWWDGVIHRSERHSQLVDEVLADRPGREVVGDSPDREVVGDRPGREVVGDRPGREVVGDRPGREVAAGDPGEHDRLLEDTAEVRAESLMAVQRLCTALLAATGGAAMESGHPAQRLSREALFYVIQAQSGDGRAAMLRRLRPPAPSDG